MNSKEILENLIHDFNVDKLDSFFRSKSRTFREINKSILTDKDNFTNGIKFGEFTTNDTNPHELAVYCFKVNKPLTESSGKKAQYDLAKKILKQEVRYSAGIFIFYDDNFDFRLSLVYDIPLSATKRDWSNFRRFTYFVSEDQTNKTFLKQIGEGDFSSLESIKEAFSVEKVTKQFYKEIANWYFWALKNVKFPADAEAEKNGKEISVIRLITRLIFIWFMKVRKLVPEELFDENALKEILTDLKLKNDNYYKAILQNLFFATLNTKQEERRFTSKKKGFKGYSKDFGNHNVYRYEDLFKNSEEAIEKYFMQIPFLNGGLFECLDYKTKTRDERKYIDGFTETKSQQPSVPNFLFFSDDKEIDLNKDYGTSNKKYNVRGLINTLSFYNFTIDESDPNDADVALDPELLGKVFENLLASYNPETAKTARKSTGSYYTPRPIVDYMVDESLKQYFKTHIQVDDIDNKLNILFSAEDQSNPFDTAQTKKLVNLIDSLRVVDPAVGSGAFPMRILNRLVFLLHKLDPDNSLWKQSQIEGIKKSVKDPILQRKFIEETERKFKEKNPDYGRKLYLIEKCIYGVDIQQIAVEIAKLRFFISLLVDEKVTQPQPSPSAKGKEWEMFDIEPLPNLEFKLMQGNSLISSFAEIDFTTKPQNDDNLFDFDEKYKQLINEFEELKSQYQNEPDVHKKRKLREEIDLKLLEIFEEKLRQHYPQLKELESKYGGRKEIIEAEKKKLFKKIGIDLELAEQDLIAYTEGRKQKDFFLWDVYFAEVFAEKGGFDIVIGNPPYIQLQIAFNNKIKYADLYKNQNFETFERTGDIYCLFYEKGIKLLRDKGLLCYITSNKWMRAGYGESLRKFFLKFNPKILIDLGPDVFENATVDTNILLIQKEQNKNELKAVTINETKKDGIDFNLILNERAVTLRKLNNDAWFIGNDAEQKLKEKIERMGKPLKDWDVKIYYGIKTGLNEAFIIDTDKRNEILANCKDEEERKRTEEIIKPILRGRDIKRYSYDWAGLWVIGTFPALHLDIEDYPAIKKYFLDNFDIRQLEQTGKKYPELGFDARKKTGNKWFETQDQIAYYPEFEKEKVVYSEIVRQPQFFYDSDKFYFEATSFLMTGTSVKYICGLLNSKPVTFFFKEWYAGGGLGDEGYRYKKAFLENLPLPPITPANEPIVNQIEALVDKILEAKKQDKTADTSHWEREIDRMVYKLYDLTDEEVKIVEGGK